MEGAATPRPTRLDEAWLALTGERTAPAIEVHGDPWLPSGAWGLDELAVATVASVLLAAAELAEARGRRRPEASLDRAHATLAFGSERLLQAERPLGPGFAPLSRFAPTADGHIRLHANYPHHRAALLRALGDPPDEGAALALVATRRGAELEDDVIAAGGAAAAVRSEADWLAHPQGRATARLGLLDLEWGEHGADPLPPPGPLPCSGLRVLDLTRVIAGPVGTRMLAALGADVLRVDPPAMPELELHLLDGTIGKRSTLLDARDRADREAFERLVAEADVVVAGYRPGALDGFGLDGSSLRARHPHLVTVTLSAWGDAGPWAERRGFDSLVQAASGIAIACSAEKRAIGEVDPAAAGTPGALPVQALDHATGYLIAAAALAGLSGRARCGRPGHARLALDRTASWLMRHRAAPTPAGPAVPAMPVEAPAPGELEPYLVEVSSPVGPLRCLTPPGAIDGCALGWPGGVPAPGGDAARWLAGAA